MVSRGYWKGVGETLASAVPRLYLTGRLTVEYDGRRLDPGDLPGRQGRLALAYLVLARTRPVPRSELVEALWPAEAPRSADTALSAVVSKVRTALVDIGLGEAVLPTNAGCYELRLPAGATVDVETAANRLDQSEGALRNGDTATAWSGATVASAILRRPLLPGDDAPWLTARRTLLANLLLRAYDCLVEVWLARGDATLAVAIARDALAVAPYRESGHRRLMRAHIAAGDRAEALRVYDACRTLLRDELGVSPSLKTRQIFDALLAEG